MEQLKRAPVQLSAIARVMLVCVPALCLSVLYCAPIACFAQSNLTNGRTQKAVQAPAKTATAKPAPAKTAPAPAQSAPSASKPTAASFINCRALETHTSAQPAVTIVVFNQRDKNDHVRLSELLKDQPGAVEIKTSDGKWHKATVARLKSCFGRGLLFLSGDMEEPKDREDFLLRFPPKSAS